MSSFFEMGGYAGYVWPAYGVALIVMVGLLVASLRSVRAREAQLKVLQESRPNRRSRATARAVPHAEEATGADA